MSRQQRRAASSRGRRTGLPIHRRIRNRRQERGLAGYELARRVGISPSYISLIEKGTKVPSEEIAEKIAGVLDDDRELYRAWAHSARVGDLEDTLSGVVRLMEISSNPHLRKLFSSGGDIETLDGVHDAAPEAPATQPGLRRGLDRVRQLFVRDRERGPALAEPGPPGPDDEEASDPPSSPTPGTALRLEDIELALAGESVSTAKAIVEVPVLAEGTDPVAAAGDPSFVEDTLSLDRRMLPHGERGELFAYRIRQGGFAGVRGQLAPGDLVVLARDIGELSTERVYAVRRGDDVVLSRVMLKNRSLLLLPEEGGSEFQVVDVDDPRQLGSVIVGRVALTTKRW